MKALTLWRPWPYAVFRLGKPIDNRPWEPPRSIIGERIAIHAGKKYDEKAAEFIVKVAGLDEIPKEPYPPGSIVGTVIVEGFYRLDGQTQLFDPTTAEISEWAFGPVCWKWSGIEELAVPIECRGHQRLWDVPEAVERLIAEQGANG